MARLNVTNGIITNEKSRRQNFSKRKKNVIKKLTELSTLCDVKVGLILYEDNGNFNISPEIHPEDPEAIKHLINKYREQPRANCKRWNTNSSTVFKSRKLKAEVDIAKLQESLMVKRSSSPLFSHPSWDGTNLEDLSQGQLAEFSKLIDEKIEIVTKAYDSKKKKQNVGNTEAVRRGHILDTTTQAMAPPLQILDMTNKAQAAPRPQTQIPAPIPAPIPVQQTTLSHPYHHAMQNWQYNMQLGTLYQHQQQIMMPFVYPHNVGIPNHYQVGETSNFNDGYYNQMESKPAASLQYDHHLPHHPVGQYAMWYPSSNPKPMLPYMQYYHGMMSNGDSANWGMKYSPEGNFGPKNLPP